MGREIRRVPLDWEHPRDEDGHYIPLHDRTYEEAAEEWLQALLRWEAGEDPARERSGIRYYWEYAGPPPEPEHYRPAWESEPTGFQVYETVSAGTPVSPVFASLDDLRAWLLAQGYPEGGVERFLATGWAPAGWVVPDRVRAIIEALGAGRRPAWGRGAMGGEDNT